PEILRIAMTGPDGQQQSVLVDAVRKAYLSEIVHKENKVRLTRLDQLKKIFAESENSLREKRETLKQMAKGLGGQDQRLLAARQELALKHLRELESELLKRQSQLRTAQLELAVEQAREKAGDKLVVPDAAVEEHVQKDIVVMRHLQD